MNNNARHIQWLLGIVAILLCLVVWRVDAAVVDSTPVPTTEDVQPQHTEYESTSASLCEKEDDMLHAVREMGQWGIPSASVTLQGTAGRVLMLSEALQRIVRTLSALLACESPCSNGVTEALRHTLSAKRFHAGYYIYYRCQMRC